MNDDNDGVVKCQKNSTTPPRCHSDQVDPLVPLSMKKRVKLKCFFAAESETEQFLQLSNGF